MKGIFSQGKVSFLMPIPYYTSMKRMLLVFAHPDDESFTCGGLVPKYVARGWHVDLVCATRGERGASGPYQHARPITLAQLRQKELEKAAQILGIASITFLEYYDGKLSGLHAGELEDKVYQTFQTFTPDVVVTFEPDGISNHPDHVKLTLSTTVAFQKYAKYAIEEEISRSPKLYYACIPESVTEYAKKINMIPDESFGRPWHGVEDKRITTVVDISKFTKIKTQALRAHVTQRDDVNRFLVVGTNPLIRQEYFVQRFEGTKEVFMGKNDRVANKL